ncbi:MAG: dTDP-4-dehydrorhamnose reductase [Pelotomaculum sp. PtaB.Bin104]|nr:MAG: dTDP-4-dehydrorhamnose reductase [Pelotomaculum sp. PtaB.Bin104]
MRVLVTGAGGMQGRQVMLEYQRRGAEVVYPTHDELDISDYRQVNAATAKVRPDIVINCAAYTNVDNAEVEKEKAFLTNGLGPRNLALACREYAATLVHISTDYIFNGQAGHPYRIYDTPCPLNVYGASKLFGEAAVRETGGKYFIVRTSWLFGPGGKNFVDTILTLAGQKDELQVVSDQHSSPTYTADLAAALAHLAASKVYGTYHTTNSGITSWYGLAKKIVASAGLSEQSNPVRQKTFPGPPPGRHFQHWILFR